MFIIIIQLVLALLAVLFLWSVFFTDQFEEGSVMKAGNLGFRIIYSIYTNTRLGSWYTKRKLNEARLKYPLGHSYLKTFTYNHIQILPIAVNQDNYTYLVIDSNTNDAVLVDVSDTETVLATLKANFVQPKAILSTHKHWDHCCGNKEMLRQFPDMKIYGSRIDKPSGVSNRVADGETFSVGSLKFSAHVMPGHTRGHVLFRLFGDSTKDMPDCLFTGDMLFLGGTGKMFECSPKTMLESLERLSEFGDDSLVWPGHEYALDNLQFAKLIDSKNENVASKKAWVKIQREQGQPTCCAFRDEMRRRLRLGYVQVVPPYLYSCGLSKNWRLCRRPGLTIELWRAIGDALNYDFDFVQAPEYGKLLNGKWTGLMGMLTNHSIDATVTFMGMTPERLKVVNYSTPVAAVQPGFVDTRSKRILHEKLLYQVFDPLTFVFLFLSTSIFGLALAYQVHSWADGAWIATAGAFQKMRLQQKTFGNLVSIVGYVFFIYSYSAGFQSQAIVESITLTPFRSLKEAKAMLRTNKVRLLTDQEGYLSLINETFFFDHASAFESLAKTVTRRREDITQELCTMPDTIFFGDANYALGNIWWTKSPCFLERIPIDPVYSAPLAVAFDKRVFKDYDLVNSMIMRVFNPDQMEKFWAPRYGARGPERPPTPKRQLRPLSMLLLEPAFVILSIGMLSSFTLLLVEALMANCFQRTKFTALLCHLCRIRQCPSTLAEERLYNPFLRTSDCSLLRALHIIDEDDPSDAPIAFGLRVTALKMIRKRKDDLAATKP